ncbi:histidinol-phosphatase [Methanosarcinales archaeon ex4572_44]|nr:MAG: histidinol-phosphatase [Methanosarcinales archaeon ex4572_44]
MHFDLHVHSTYSGDSITTIAEIIKSAEATGLAGVAICDHNTTEGAIKAMKLAKELRTSVQIIPGIEVSTSEGHLLVLGVTEPLPPGKRVEETIRAADKLDGLSIAPHPFKYGRKKGIGHAGSQNVDAIETMNSRCRLTCSNKRARQMAEALGKPQVAGSDSHRPETIGMAYTEITPLSGENILDAIREGRTLPRGRIAPIPVVIKQACKAVLCRFNP